MGPMIQTSTLRYRKPVNIEIIEVMAFFYINDCEVLMVDSFIQELKLTPLKVESLKGRNALEGRERILCYMSPRLHFIQVP